MKKLFVFSVLVVALSLVLQVSPTLAAPALPTRVGVQPAQFDPPTDLELTGEQVVIVGIVATLLINGLRLLYEYAAKKKFVIPELAMQSVVLIISLGLALLWFPMALPPFPNFAGLEAPEMVQAGLNFLYVFLMSLGGMFAVSHYFYKLLIKRIREALGKTLMPQVYKVGGEPPVGLIAR